MFLLLRLLRSVLCWRTSISVLPVDSVTVSGSSWSGGVGGRGGKVKVGEGGTKSAGSGKRSVRLTSSSASPGASYTLRLTEGWAGDWSLHTITRIRN